MRKKPRFACIYSYWSYAGQPDALQHNGMTNSETEKAKGSKEMWKRTLKMLLLKRERDHQAVLFLKKFSD